MNFTKPDSLFNFGMQVCMYSQLKANGSDTEEENDPKERKGWFRGGDKISYFCNGIKKDVGYTSKTYYTLTFTYTFQHDDDVRLSVSRSLIKKLLTSNIAPLV